MGQVEGRDRPNRGVGLQDRERIVGVRARTEHHLRVHREVGEGATRHGGPRRSSEQQDARDQSRCDRHTDQCGQGPSRLANDETDGVTE